MPYAIRRLPHSNRYRVQSTLDSGITRLSVKIIFEIQDLGYARIQVPLYTIELLVQSMLRSRRYPELKPNSVYSRPAIAKK